MCRGTRVPLVYPTFVESDAAVSLTTGYAAVAACRHISEVLTPKGRVCFTDSSASAISLSRAPPSL